MKGIKNILTGMIMVFLVILGTNLNPKFVFATDGLISIESISAISEFPRGIHFKIKATGDNEINKISVRLQMGGTDNTTYNYMEFDPSTVVEANLFWRTDTSLKYIPPGTVINYYFEIEDVSGSTLKTELKEFIYYDPRFTWTDVSSGPITVSYHGPVERRATIVLDAITQTLGFMGPLLGADIERSIRVTMYNNVKEMIEALPPGSSTVRRELITEGQAFSGFDALIVLGSGRAANGTASHELIHILVDRAGGGRFSNIPSWLNEGLAEYGNVAPGYSYDIALEYAIHTDNMLPVTSLRVIPGDPEEAIIFYGQSRSLVRFMVENLGPMNIKDLMATLQSGTNVNQAVEEIYGVSKLKLENMWREWIGAPLLDHPEGGFARPTPISLPSVSLYTLTPQPLSETITAVNEDAEQDLNDVISNETSKVTGSGCNKSHDGNRSEMDISLFMFIIGLTLFKVRQMNH